MYIPGKKSSMAIFMICTLVLFLPIKASATHKSQNICSKSSYLSYRACGYEAKEDFLVAKAKCLNITDNGAQTECHREARQERRNTLEECEEQFEARNDLCGIIGEAPYDPSGFWKAENFVDPLEIGTTVAPNPYLPLVQGTSILQGDETITVTVTSDTKLIAGVTCLVVRDYVDEDGKVIEDTDDWFAQDIYGNVWYCGEVSKNYELFEGDLPGNPELVDLDGSWKAFRDYAMPGIVMQAAPQTGDVYRMEMLHGDAEDVAEILETSASGLLEGDICNEDHEKIANFVTSMCDDNCLITKDFTTLEPGHVEHKYYAYNYGFIMEIDEEGSCTVAVIEN